MPSFRYLAFDEDFRILMDFTWPGPGALPPPQFRSLVAEVFDQEPPGSITSIGPINEQSNHWANRDDHRNNGKMSKRQANPQDDLLPEEWTDWKDEIEIRYPLMFEE